MRARTRAWFGRRLQGGIGGGGGFELRAPACAPAPARRRECAAAASAGPGPGSGCRPRPCAGPSASRLLPASRRPIAPVASSPRPAARPSSLAISPAPAAARSDPSASSPLPSAPAAIPPRSCSTARAARRSPGPSRSSSPNAGRWADFPPPAWVIGPSAPEVRDLPRRRSGAVALATGPGPITAAHARLGGDAPLPARQQRQVALGRDRPPFGGGDEDEGRLPAGPDRARRSSRRSRAPGWRPAARRCRGRRW